MSFRCSDNPQEHDEFIVYPALPLKHGEWNRDGHGFIVDRDGKMTNRFSDGVVGVPEYLREYVEEEMQAECAMCGELVEWQHED